MGLNQRGLVDSTIGRALKQKMEDLKEEIKHTKVIVHSGRYAYLQTKEFPKDNNHFLVSKDKDEITVITKEENIKDVDFVKDYKWFKLIEFKVTKPFLVVGFLATISKIIADKGLNILMVSTFSKDYVLINEKDIDIAIKAFRDYGFKVE